METVRGELTDDELETVVRKMTSIRDTEGAPLTVAIGSPYDCLQNLYIMSTHGQVEKFYDNGEFVGILVFDVGKLWWSDKDILLEQFVLSVTNKAGFQREAIKRLNEIAKEFDVYAICSGCIYQDKPQMVMNGYYKDGFVEVAPTAIKILKTRNDDVDV